jgi:SOS-response transcriptional repressor LexA
MTTRFTDAQGQYLAFIYAYRKLHRRSPAEADFQAYFEVTPPSVHRMIVVLTERGLIRRRPGAPRSIERLIPPEELPLLGSRTDQKPCDKVLVVLVDVVVRVERAPAIQQPRVS